MSNWRLSSSIKKYRPSSVQPEVMPPIGNEGHHTNKIRYIKKHLLNKLAKMEIARPFLVPVDVDILNVPSYYNIIKKPMDLGTIEQRVKNRYYHGVGELVDDIELIVSNSHAFNPPDSSVCKCADELEKLMQKVMEKLPQGDEIPYRTANTEKRRLKHQCQTKLKQLQVCTSEFEPISRNFFYSKWKTLDESVEDEQFTSIEAFDECVKFILKQLHSKVQDIYKSYVTPTDIPDDKLGEYEKAKIKNAVFMQFGSELWHTHRPDFSWKCTVIDEIDRTMKNLNEDLASCIPSDFTIEETIEMKEWIEKLKRREFRKKARECESGAKVEREKGEEDKYAEEIFEEDEDEQYEEEICEEENETDDVEDKDGDDMEGEVVGGEAVEDKEVEGKEMEGEEVEGEEVEGEEVEDEGEGKDDEDSGDDDKGEENGGEEDKDEENEDEVYDGEEDDKDEEDEDVEYEDVEDEDVEDEDVEDEDVEDVDVEDVDVEDVDVEDDDGEDDGVEDKDVEEKGEKSEKERENVKYMRGNKGEADKATVINEPKNDNEMTGRITGMIDVQNTKIYADTMIEMSEPNDTAILETPNVAQGVTDDELDVMNYVQDMSETNVEEEREATVDYELPTYCKRLLHVLVACQMIKSTLSKGRHMTDSSSDDDDNIEAYPANILKRRERRLYEAKLDKMCPKLVDHIMLVVQQIECGKRRKLNKKFNHFDFTPHSIDTIMTVLKITNELETDNYFDIAKIATRAIKRRREMNNVPSAGKDLHNPFDGPPPPKYSKTEQPENLPVETESNGQDAVEPPTPIG